MDSPKSQTGQPVIFGQGRSTLVKHTILTLFFAGASSAGTLNGLEKRIVCGSSSPTRLFLEISKNNKLKGINCQA